MEIKEDDYELVEPVSPTAQCFNSSVLSTYVIVVLEFETSIDASKIMPFVKDLLPLNHLYSSIMVKDINGEKKWKKVEVKIEEHIIIPTLPSNLSHDEVALYDSYLDEYLTNLAIEEISQNKPLWEVHIINHPWNKKIGNLILKQHHSLGDGYSMMGILICSLKRADDSSIPLTFASRKLINISNYQYNILNRASQIIFSTFNGILDFGWGVIKSTVLEDDLTPIRSGGGGGGGGIDQNFRPAVTISTLTLSLHQIKELKSKLNVTINDVVTGMIFLGLRLYIHETCPDLTQSNSTALVLLNTRMFGNYKSVEDMLKPNSNAPWGNRFAFLNIDIPKVTEADLSNPLQFIKAAHKMIKNKRNSYAVFFVGKLMQIIHKFRGSEAAAKYLYKTIHNSSVSISNMIGPNEKMALCGHSIKGFYFTVVGIPQSLMITVGSYMDNLRITFGCEKDFIDQKKLSLCIEKAFEKIVKVSIDVSISTLST